MTDWGQVMGEAFTSAYFAYAIFLLAIPTYLLLHLFAVLVAAICYPVDDEIPRPVRWVIEAAEAFYGLTNPIFYLLFLGPYLAWSRPAHSVLFTVAWVLLLALWGVRILVPRPLSNPLHRTYSRRLCALTLVWLVVFALRDLIGLWTQTLTPRPGELVRLFVLTGVLAPLYIVPAILLDRQRRLLADQETSAFLLFRHGARRLPVYVAAAIATVVVAMTVWRPTAETVESRLLSLRPTIQAAAARHAVDPGVIAAILYQTQRYQISAMRQGFEDAAMTAFVSDGESHFGLSRATDLSIGLAQVKPITAITAVVICERASQTRPTFWSTHARDVPSLGREWQLPFSSRVGCAPPLVSPRSKTEMVRVLLTDEGSIEYVARLLSLYQAQWKLTRPEWEISGRPDILATLYQIGFERSRPHASPRSNDFGRDVHRAYRAWAQPLFNRNNPSGHNHLEGPVTWAAGT